MVEAPFWSSKVNSQKLTKVSLKILIQAGMGGRKKISCSDLVDWDVLRNKKNFCLSPPKNLLKLGSWKSTLVLILDILYSIYGINLEKDLKEDDGRRGEENTEEAEDLVDDVVDDVVEEVEERVEDVVEEGEERVEDTEEEREERGEYVVEKTEERVEEADNGMEADLDDLERLEEETTEEEREFEEVADWSWTWLMSSCFKMLMAIEKKICPLSSQFLTMVMI